MCVVLGRSVVGGGSEGLLGRPPAMCGLSVFMLVPGCCLFRSLWEGRRRVARAGGVICEKCSEKLHSYPAYPACSVEPLEIWLTHVQRAFREKAVSHFRPDCQPRGRGGVSGAAAH